MNPDSEQTRIGRLEQQMAATRQQVSNVVEDLRVYAPLIASQAEMRATLSHIQSDLTAQARDLAELKKALERNEQERRFGQEQRATEDKKSRTLIWGAVLGLFGTFVMSAATIIAVVIQP